MMRMVCRYGCRVPYCQSVCPMKAITVEVRSVHVESESCIGCGTCRYVCGVFGLEKGLEKKPVDWLMGKA